jgi:flagellar hook-associated protein 3 FlgL
MIRNFDPTTENFLTNLNVSQRRMDLYLGQLSSGYRVTRPSDAPEDVISILRTQADLARGSQVQSNLTRLRNEVDAGEATLQVAVTLLDKANVLGAQALGVGQTAESRAALAQQVRDLHSQLVGLTQLNVQGRFVFSGDNDQQPQYALDATDLVTGVRREFVTAETRVVGDLFDTEFSAAKTANEIFDSRDAADVPDDKNVFRAVYQLWTGLETGDDSLIEQAVGWIKNANDWVNRNLAAYGTVQNRIAQSLSIAKRYEVEWNVQLSAKRDADAVEAISALNAIQIQRDASMSAQAQFQRRNLFEFLR